MVRLGLLLQFENLEMKWKILRGNVLLMSHEQLQNEDLGDGADVHLIRNGQLKQELTRSSKCRIGPIRPYEKSCTYSMAFIFPEQAHVILSSVCYR